MKKIFDNFFRGIEYQRRFFLYSILLFLCSFYSDYDTIIKNYKSNDHAGVLMHFRTVSEVFEKISAISSRIEMTKLLADLLQKASPKEAECICNLSLGLLRPSYQGGTQFNMAEKSLIKVVASLLDLSADALHEKVKELGDIGLAFDLIDGWKLEAELTVLEVYDALLELEQLSGIGSQEEKYHYALKLLKKLDPISAKYVVRIILGKLRLGFSDMTLIDSLSWMEVGDKSLSKKIEEAYNTCADIGLIAYTLKQAGIQAIEHMHSTLGIPIRMAAAERLPDAKSIYEKLGYSIAQPKLDGFRLQIHVDKTHPQEPKIKLFSRNLLDMSAMFPDVVEEVLKLDVKQLICEGEAIAYDPNTGIFVPFQETVKRKRKHGIEQAVTDYPLQVFLFDILYLNGQDLMDKTHHERRKYLEKTVYDYRGQTVKIIPEIAINSALQLEEYFLKNIDAGLEGIMVKKINSIYQPGKRNFNWIKLKRITQGHLEDTIDVVVLGYYHGKGKRVAFGIGAFLVGIFNKDKDCFQTIAKVGTGLKDEEWKEFKRKCDILKVEQKPKNVECPKELFPDVWVDPKMVCVVRADEITLSPLHTAGKTEHSLGFALRFPRFIGYRPDKGSEESTTPEEIKKLYKDQTSKS